MIIEIISDMRYFVLVLMLAVLAFGNSFYILGRNDTSETPFSGSTYPLAFIMSWRMGTGDFDSTTFATRDEVLIWILWFLNTLIINIIFFNLVIALMGDTFERVQSTAEAAMLWEICGLMLENEFLFNRNWVFKGMKYILVIKTETAETSSGGSWEGKLNTLKRSLEESSENHIEHLKKLNVNLDKML